MSRVRTSHAPDGWRDLGPQPAPQSVRRWSVVQAFGVGEMVPTIRNAPPKREPKAATA